MGEFFAFLMASLLFSFDGMEPSLASPLPGAHFEVAPPPTPFLYFSPVITAPSALITDVASSGEIWAFHPDEKRAMASLTKLMVVLIILEDHELSEVAAVPNDFLQIEGSKMNLVPGERITVGNLLRGTLINSAGDAARVLAIYHSGSEEAFVDEMNQRTLTLGMEDTHFENVHGLDEEGHVSTARDLSILSRKVLEHPEVRPIIATKLVTVSSVDGEISHDLRTTNALLYSPFSVTGFKTGTTDEAGECLITLFEDEGKEYLIVLLGSTDRFGDAKAILSPFLREEE